MATLRERLACFPSVAANGAALSARTHNPVADDTDGAHVEGIVERVNAYGFQADPVTTSNWWWLPFLHTHTVTPLSTGVTVTWPL